MGVVKAAVAAMAMVAVQPVDARPPIDRQAYIAEASARFSVPEAWIRRVMAAESRGRTTLSGRPIRSPKGAMGLMQLMPATWAEMRDSYRLGRNPDDPHDNILAGTAYLRLMYDRFGYPGLFGAYNAGPARYAAYVAGQRPLPGETQAYLAALSGAPSISLSAQLEHPREGLFSVVRDHPNDPPAAGGDRPQPPPPPTLFSIPERR